MKTIRPIGHSIKNTAIQIGNKAIKKAEASNLGMKSNKDFI
jgi:hypothetical protein